MKLVLTCEHGGNQIPKPFQSSFEHIQDVLRSHKGYDLGALDVFNTLLPLSDFSKSSTTSRLVVELNRSLHHRLLFSEYSKGLSKAQQQTLINTYYLPYRREIETAIKNYIEMGEYVLHLAVHSFTPVLQNVERHCDIGLLYDSSNVKERHVCRELKREISNLDNRLKIRFNYPYLGKADGLTTYLRKQYKANYLGIELEINQKFSKNNTMDTYIKTLLFNAFKHVMEMPIYS